MSYAPGGWGAFLALSRDPANRSQWLAGADVGGLYVSVDDGVSWQSCNAGISTLWVMAIAFSRRGPILGTSAGVYCAASDATAAACGPWRFADCSGGLHASNSTEAVERLLPAWRWRRALLQPHPRGATQRFVHRGAEDARILARGRATQHDCGRGALSSRLL